MKLTTGPLYQFWVFLSMSAMGLLVRTGTGWLWFFLLSIICIFCYPKMTCQKCLMGSQNPMNYYYYLLLPHNNLIYLLFNLLTIYVYNLLFLMGPKIPSIFIGSQLTKQTLEFVQLFQEP